MLQTKHGGRNKDVRRVKPSENVRQSLGFILSLGTSASLYFRVPLVDEKNIYVDSDRALAAPGMESLVLTPAAELEFSQVLSASKSSGVRHFIPKRTHC